MSYQTIETAAVRQTVDSVLASQGLASVPSVLKLSGGGEHLCYNLNALIQNVRGDLVTPQLRVTNSGDGTRAFRIHLGLLRWACTNGLVVGYLAYSERIVHREGPVFDRKYLELEEKLADGLEVIVSGELAEIVSDLGGKTLTRDQSVSVIGNLPIPVRAKDTSISRVFYPRRVEDARSNVWALWNNVNESIRERGRSPQQGLTHNKDLLEHIKCLAEAV